uniref:Uncharacterized protein n=1 Tax=Arundo donax TaxID=35708 RepID=A0A0A9DFR7_ARUDO
MNHSIYALSHWKAYSSIFLSRSNLGIDLRKGLPESNLTIFNRKYVYQAIRCIT